MQPLRCPRLSFGPPFLVVIVILGNALPAKAEGPSRRDPQIEAALREIDVSRIRARIEKLASFGTRHTLSDTTSDVRGIGAARRWIKSEFEHMAAASSGRLIVADDSYVQEPARRVNRATEIVNVTATQKGRQASSADRIIVLGAHYDSIPSMKADGTDPNADAPGANDDASGTAVIMELAEVLSKRDWDATLVFAAFAGEEQGLYGSTHFAQQAHAACKNLEAMITNDIVGNTAGGDGRRDNRTLRVFSEGMPAVDSPLAARLRMVGGESDGPSRQLARYIQETAELYVPDFRVRLIFRSDRYLRGGDHLPFAQRGYPAVRFTEPAENFARQHQDVRMENGIAYGDVVSGVDFDYVAHVARVNAAVAGALALAPAPPGDVAIETRKLEYDTTLTWTAPRDTGLAGFEIVWRDTTAARWEHALEVGKVSCVTLAGLSKDDWYFGVRSVDARGHRSPVAFPLAGGRQPPRR